MKRKVKAREITLVGILGAITVVLGFSPLGFIPVGPAFATIMQVPVIIGGILGGPLVGASVGFIFGASSYYNAIIRPLPTSFVFLNPLISILPRVLIGLVSSYVYRAFKKSGKISGFLARLVGLLILIYLSYNLYSNWANHSKSYIVINLVLIALTISLYAFGSHKDMDTASIMAAASGTLTNTVLVLGLVYFFYGRDFVEAMGKSGDLARSIIIGIGVMNGIPEVIISIILVSSIVKRIAKKI